MKNIQVNKATVKIYPSREDMGAAAARDAARTIRALLEDHEEINIIFAAAPSQNEFLRTLSEDKSIDFSRINALHMDEYIGLPPDAPQAFGNYLNRAIFSKVQFKSVNYMNGSNPDRQAECRRYAELYEKYPPHIVFMGVGENGHIAFNDPHVADFDDPKIVKIVELDPVCRSQQVNDGCFQSLSEVPTHAFTLTIPALLSAGYIFCIVPSMTKAAAVRNAVQGEITEECPASILQTKENSVIYLDPESASLLENGTV